MGFGLQNQPIVATPAGNIDSAHPDGNDGSNLFPVWNLTGFPDLTTLMTGTAFSVDLSLYLADPGSPSSSIGFAPASGQDPRGAGFSVAGTVLSNPDTLATSGAFYLVAVRNNVSAVSPRIAYKISTPAGVDNVAPTIPTGVTCAPGSALDTISLTFDPPCDIAPGTTTASGSAHVDVFLNGASSPSAPSPIIVPANSLPAPSSVNIGSISSPDIPAFTQAGKVWTLSAAGTGIASTASEQCLLQDFGTFTGAQKFTAKLDSFTSSASTALIGLMLHETAVAGGKFIAVGLRPSNGTTGLYVYARTASGGTSTLLASLTADSNGQPIVGPVYVQISRSSDLKTYAISYSLNGLGWRTVTTQVNAMLAAVHYGLFATSQTAGTDVAGSIEEVAITNSAPITVTISATANVQIQLRSVDNAGNTSALSTAIQGIPNLGGQSSNATLYISTYGCQYDNQFYLTGVEGTNFRNSLSAIGPDNTISVVEIYTTWGECEGPTQGNYSGMDSIFNDVVSHLTGLGHKVYFFINNNGPRTFNGSNSTNVFPQYALNNGWVVQIPASTGFNGYIVTWQNPATVAAYTAMLTRMADKWGSHPLCLGMSTQDETDMVTNVAGCPSDTQWYAVYKQMQFDVKAHLPNRWLWVRGNWMPPGGTLEVTRLCDLVSSLNAQYPGGVAFGGPDYVQRNTTFQKCWRGEAGTLGDLRRKYPWIGHVEETSLGGSPGPTILWTPASQIAQSVSSTGTGSGGGMGADIWIGNNTNAYTYKWSSGSPSTDELTAIHNGPLPLQPSPPSIGTYIPG